MDSLALNKVASRHIGRKLWALTCTNDPHQSPHQRQALLTSPELCEERCSVHPQCRESCWQRSDQTRQQPLFGHEVFIAKRHTHRSTSASFETTGFCSEGHMMLLHANKTTFERQLVAFRTQLPRLALPRLKIPPHFSQILSLFFSPKSHPPRQSPVSFQDFFLTRREQHVWITGPMKGTIVAAFA